VNFVIFSKTDASELKIVLIWGDNWLKTFMNTASKEVVCFKTIMQHSLVYASSAISCIRAPENPFFGTQFWPH
jgi:hypothetical protein